MYVWGTVLPNGNRERNQLANLLNRESGEALADEVFQTTAWVRNVFDEVFSSTQSDLAEK
jgi:glutamine synthetase adenylyltransferase